MLVEPPVTEILKKVEDRYSLIIMTSKRARQIAAGAKKLTDAEDKSPVTLAVDEIFEGSVYKVENYVFTDDSVEEVSEEEKIEE